MMRTCICVIILVSLRSIAAFGHPAQTQPAFEAADVHTSPPTTIPFMSGGVLRGGRYELRTATMVDLIKTAYGVTDDKVVGGPSWLGADRFDVIARAPVASSPETVRKMLQTLLADRFKLVVHNDTRPLSVYALTAGKGRPKMKESDSKGGSGCQGQPRTPEPGVIPYQVVSCRNMTMAEFAEELPGMAGAYILNPVIDLTELKGPWDFDVKWTARLELAAAGSEGISIFDAVEKQLGLKLELQKKPMPVIVVDQVNQKPTANLPSIAESIPPAPTEFEVAVVKPSPPDFSGPPNGGFQPGGRIDVHGITLKDVITLAWDIRPDMIVGAPKWLDSDRFEIVAKAPAGGPASGRSAGPPIDLETLRTMLRALIVERFKLTSHKEDRSIDAYAIVVPKTETKLKKADPSSRSECKRGAGPASNPSLTQSFTCTNTTMAQFASQIQTWAPAYIDHAVVDTTRLDGAWDFVLSWTPKGALMSASAVDPSGGLTIFEAADKQLGLKLVLQKNRMPVLVIDHVEQKPTNQ